MDRRHFVTAAAGLAVLSGTAPAMAQAAQAAPGPLGLNVLDLGVEANTEADQSPRLAKAITDMTATGSPLWFPPGRYTFRTPLGQAERFAFLAAVGAELVYSGAQPFLTARNAMTVSGLTVRRLAQGSASPMFAFTGAFALIEGCSFMGGTAPAMTMETARAADGQAASVRVTGCNISGSGSVGLKVVNAVRQFPVSVTQNQFAGCGLHVEGDATLQGNTVVSAPDAGIRLGSATKLGSIIATGNLVMGSPVGIAISNAPDGYAMVTINMVRGAKNGAIRAFDGDRYVGRDLVQSSSESFPYIAVGGNVSA
jgi:hypothetical protein